MLDSARTKHMAAAGDVVGTTRSYATQRKLIGSTRRIQIAAAAVLLLLVITAVALTFLPWQQSARGYGRVLALSPQERVQEVLSPSKGIIERISEGLVEGSYVRRGQELLELKPMAVNLQDQVDAQRANLQSKLEIANQKVDIYTANVENYKSVRQFTIAAAEQAIEAAKAKLAAKESSIPGYESKVRQAKLNYERQRQLQRSGLAATKEVEKLEKDLDVALAELEQLKADVMTAQSELAEKKADLDGKRTKAETEVQKAEGDLAAARSDVETINKDLGDLDIKLGELDRLVVRAPANGTIHRLPVFVGGQTVKESGYLLTIVPEVTEPAVELLIDGNDLPLVHLGDEVRLQFEGWPAIQFSGWPAVARGTFGGKVTTIDLTDDGIGRFRVLVTQPDKAEWPESRYLRQGVQANGWVMLDTVPLYYEIWRQLNGFPPQTEPKVGKDAGSKTDDKGKKPKIKLPK